VLIRHHDADEVIAHPGGRPGDLAVRCLAWFIGAIINPGSKPPR